MIVEENVTKFIRENLKSSDGLMAAMERYASEHYVPIAKPETAAFLRTLCAIKRPLKILEAGTAIGYSAITMAPWLSDGGRIDTVEIDEDTASIAAENVKKSGFSNCINIIIADAAEVFSCIDSKYDMIFMDAAKGQYAQMYDDAKRLLNIGGILVTDNVLFDGRVSAEGIAERKFRTIVVNMRKYIKKLIEDDCFETSFLSVGDGITLSVKIKEGND